MKRIFGILILFYLAAGSGEVQSQSITWNRTYNGPYNWYDVSYDICQTTDGNFIAVGYTRNPNYSICALKINQYGDTIWFKTIINVNTIFSTAYSVTYSNDGGCLLTGENDSLFVAKIDSSGNLSWLKYYGNGRGYDIYNTQDNNFLICGEGGFVLKINNNGDIIWKKYFNSYILNKAITGIDDGYIFTGTVQNSGFSNASLIKTDTSGNLEWQSNFLLNNSTGSVAVCKFKNSYIIAGRTNAIIGQIRENFILNTDINGTETSRKIFISNKSEFFNDLVFLNNNRFAICSDRDSNSFNPIYRLSKIYIVDSTGNIITERIYNNFETQSLRSITKAGNGDILFSGFSRVVSFGGIDDIWIIRTDSLLQSPSVNIVNLNNQVDQFYFLNQNYPNPFNPVTTISFSLPHASYVKLKVFDAAGRELKVLADGYRQRGSYEVKFDGSDLASGIYFCRLAADDFTAVRRMVLLK